MGVIGIKAPVLLCCYYVFMGVVKKSLMPGFGRLSAEESQVEGEYRGAHQVMRATGFGLFLESLTTIRQRLIANAEEIAFYDGSQREKGIIKRLFCDVSCASLVWSLCLVCMPFHRPRIHS